MTSSTRLSLALATVAMLAAPGTSQAATCESLASFTRPKTAITSASVVAPGPFTIANFTCHAPR